ncbi:MAG: DNA-binding protein [Microbacterium sp.]|jgi:predicted site-specific integrase-resolvase|uniref:DNA-binding protein n=1 Tax=Microbacterium ginsengisoli TaxID=400772 RepID=A0A0F0LWF8_9MICO|nr:helix-turn-helix domain-containing protein [Microbacterium ginsengisoli]KJL37844.1 Helix-turn-helix domain protein [Microbacterium ginsengisoli]MAL07211.1 DNA-binding protein [Microbacterium sp.]MBN9208817.1 helix-turn-helix domain-containing protein [Microbacterium ginsengisoli]HAN25209.1 DNA-binding protein [Microbacterium ginsengisoli]|tara:strand:+ start:635 stop:805 length:171 start_codon:yes stop_codon:yes gene_type:complete
MQKLLTSKEVAGMLDVSESTLSRWREAGTGPRFANLDGIIRYAQGDVIAYAEGKRA